jgi:hypothetical protein
VLGVSLASLAFGQQLATGIGDAAGTITARPWSTSLFAGAVQDEPESEGDIASATTFLAGRRELDSDSYIDLQFYAWIPFSVDGDSTVAGLTVDIDLGPEEVFDLFNGAFSLRTEFWRGNLGAFADLQYVKLGQERSLTEVKIDNGVFDFGAIYRAARAPLTDDPAGSHLIVDVFAGGRLQYLEQEITVGPVNPDDDASWLGPLVGARFIMTLNDKWSVMLRGDVGGFGVNEDEDLNWSVLLGARWQFARNWDMRFGYRAFGSEYLEDEGSPRAFGQDLIMHGPYIGVACTF